VPQSIQKRELRRILEKHGLPPALIRQRIRRDGGDFLRQSLFRTTVHRWIRELIGFDPHHGWREPYR
jgi:hypothetical protein